MSNVAKVAGQAANTLVKPLDIAEVFSTYLYKGSNTLPNVQTTGVDGTEGALVWIKCREAARDQYLIDTEQGKYLCSAETTAGVTNNGTAITSTGFNLLDGAATYNDGTTPGTYAAWTFRKAKKFFDVVTYTGNGVAGKTVSHNLGSVPGMILLKRTDSSGGWRVYHRSANGGTYPEQYYAMIQSTNAFAAASTVWNNTAPTDSVFTLGTDGDSNTNGGTYVAYLFAHNDGDGGFGSDGDQDIIKCGSISGSNGRAELGFEPQWVLLKLSNSTSNWILLDVMRGWTPGNANDDAHLFPNLNNTEANYDGPSFDATGFNYGQSGENWIYVAIRAPMITPPAAATDVFAIDTFNAGGESKAPTARSGFPVDMAFYKATTGTGSQVSSRKLQARVLNATSSGAESSEGANTFDYNNGYYRNAIAIANYYAWMWKRAKGFFDVVSYTGTGGALNVSHSLGVAPEMIWVKNRVQADSWAVYYGNNEFYLTLNDNGQPIESANYWNDTSPTSSVFTVKNNHMVGASGETYIAYLFATLAGISKVGSVSHSGSSTDVDCGFSNGARFVLLKRTDAAGHWYYWDSLRGIVAGNDPYMLINTTGAQVTNTDYIDPLSSGFTITGDFTDGDYIFYAIA